MVTSKKQVSPSSGLSPAAWALNELLLDAWWRVSRYINSEFEGARALDNLTLGQLRILEALKDGPITMTEVARAAGVTRGAATGMVDRMVARGLVKRFEPPANRRSVMVRMTAEGARLKVVVHERTVRRASTLTASWTPQEREALAGLLQRLADTAKRNGRGIAAL